MALESRSSRLPGLAVLLVTLTAVLLVIPSAFGQLPELVVRVSDTLTGPGVQNTVVSVYLSNYQDTIAGFNLWLQLDRNDIMIFQTDIDTAIDTLRYLCTDWDGEVCQESLFVYGDTLFWRCDEYIPPDQCVDSTLVPPDSSWDWWHLAEWDFAYIDTYEIQIGNIDTAGTLVSGWEWVNSRSISGHGTDLNIAGIADLPTPAGETPGIAPQQGGVLIKLLADIYEIPDTLEDREVSIMIQSDFLAHFNFSRPDGTSIGLRYEERPDTNCWICTMWNGSTCLNWKRVSLPPEGGCDSIHVEMDTIAYVDTANVWLYDGSLTVLQGLCGDFDGSGDGPDIVDLVYLVNYMFSFGPPPVPLWVANVDCENGDNPDVSDLVYTVNYMFLFGPELCPYCK